jgi:hypothetical protein
MVAKFNSKTHLQNTFFVFFEPFGSRLTFPLLLLVAIGGIG